MQTVKTTLIALACALLLGACGNKGPLYLPAESPETEVVSGQEAAAEDESTDADKNGENDEKKGTGA